jgi:hypothetical protein
MSSRAVVDPGVRAGVQFGGATLLLFVVVQLCDGLLTYTGVAVFGPPIEANPLVHWYIGAFGTAPGLLFVKLLAVGCAVILHRTAQHRTLAGLTIFYLAGAVVPWVTLLASAP